MKAEIRALREERDEWRRKYLSASEELDRYIATLDKALAERDRLAIIADAIQAERDRLRAALEEIANYVTNPGDEDYMQRIARRAL